MNRRRAAALAVSAVLAVTAIPGLTACGDEGADMPTMTKAQALAQATDYVDQAAARFDPKPDLSPIAFPETTPCDDVVPGQVSVPVAVWFNVPRLNMDVFNTLFRYWTDNGYEILTDDRAAASAYLLVQSPGDGFRLSLTENSGTDAISLIVSSPCIWPEGTPAA